VSAEDSGSKEDLCNSFELHPPWIRDFLNPLSGGGGDAHVLQQSSKPASGNWSFGPKGLHLIHISIHLLILGVTQGEGTLCWPYLLRPSPSAVAAPHQASPEPLDSWGPPALSPKAHPPMMHLEVCQAVTPRVVAHFKVPADQQADGRCPCMRCGGCEPSII
jgi:hypothetical protein